MTKKKQTSSLLITGCFSTASLMTEKFGTFWLGLEFCLINLSLKARYFFIGHLWG